jgi:hypothetical protein
MKYAEFENMLLRTIRKLGATYEEERGKKRIGDRIWRGRARSIAQNFEDDIAHFILKYLDSNSKHRKQILILIDAHLAYMSATKGKKPFASPDILICREHGEELTVIGWIELKANLGWTGNKFYSEVTENIRLISRNRTVSTKSFNNKKYSVTFGSSFDFFVLILQVANAHKKLADIVDRDDVCVLIESVASVVALKDVRRFKRFLDKL